MRRSQLNALINAMEVPGDDDPEVRFKHDERHDNGSSIGFAEVHNGVIMLRNCDQNATNEEPQQVPLTLAERDALHEDNGNVSILFRKDNPNLIPFHDLIGHIEKILEPLMGEVLDSYLVAVGTEKVIDMIQTFYANRKFCMIFDGVRITGGKVFKKAHNAVGLEFITEWMPYARYNNADPTWMPLGFHKQFDLYYAIQNGLPPTLIIKNGHQAENYMSYNPFLQDTLPGLEVYLVALERAATINRQFAERHQELTQ